MASKDGTIRWLLVGTGDIVNKRVAPALASAPHAKLIGVVGQIHRAKAIATKFDGVHPYGDLDEALRHSPADAVYVATPVYRHRDEATRVLRAGKHVLVEKPLGLNADDAGQIARAADEAG